MAIIDADTEVPAPFKQDVAATQRYLETHALTGLFGSTRPGK